MRKCLGINVCNWKFYYLCNINESLIDSINFYCCRYLNRVSGALRLIDSINFYCCRLHFCSKMLKRLIDFINFYYCRFKIRFSHLVGSNRLY